MTVSYIYRYGYMLLFTLLCSLMVSTGMYAEDRSRTFHIELDYLEAVVGAVPTDDHSSIFGLLAQYNNVNQQERGMRYIERILQENPSRLSGMQKAYYTCTLGLLRLSHTYDVGFLRRIGWVNASIDMLEEALRLSKEDTFPIRWMLGTTYTQLPGVFGKRDNAGEHIEWCMKNIAEAPNPGWMRELYYQKGVLAKNDDKPAEAQKYLAASGYKNFEKEIYLSTPYSVEAERGLLLYPPRLRYVVPDTVICISGFDVSELYFIISDDREQLIAINMGTRPETVKQALGYMKTCIPGLPKLTTVLVTNIDWLTIGGHKSIRDEYPAVRIIAQDTWSKELESLAKQPIYFKYIFGEKFQKTDALSFVPDETLSSTTTLVIGGTEIRMIPAMSNDGGDMFFVYLPDESALYVGNALNPYFGFPYLDEGDISAYFSAMDRIQEMEPSHLLHTYETMNRFFGSSQIVAELKHAMLWLYDEVMNEIQKGASRESIHHKNLIAPGISGNSRLHYPYMICREHFINRLYDQHVGYWGPNLEGIFILNEQEIGLIFSEYLEIPEKDLIAGLEKMMKNGEYELAIQLIRWIEKRYPSNQRIQEVKQKSYLKLKEKYMEFDPMKFAVFSEMIQDDLPQLQFTRENVLESTR